jgi:hypothetical protein
LVRALPYPFTYCSESSARAHAPGSRRESPSGASVQIGYNPHDPIPTNGDQHQLAFSQTTGHLEHRNPGQDSPIGARSATATRPNQTLGSRHPIFQWSPQGYPAPHRSPGLFYAVSPASRAPTASLNAMAQAPPLTPASRRRDRPGMRERGRPRRARRRGLTTRERPRSGRLQAVEHQVTSGHNRTQQVQTSRSEQVSHPAIAGSPSRSRKVWLLTIGDLPRSSAISSHADQLDERRHDQLRPCRSLSPWSGVEGTGAERASTAQHER